MSKFRFVIVSKNEESKLNKSDFASVEEQINNNVWYYNNTEELPKVYNKELARVRKDKDVDFLVFMHADVFFNVSNVINHALQCKDKYDIMGLCGCSKISVSQSPLNWFAGSNKFPNERWGMVSHGEVNSRVFYNQHSPNVTDHDVACIDGLCIIFGPNALASDITFNEKIRFNCYDTQISFSAVIEKKLRLGVIVEQSLEHYSIGKQIMGEDFLKDEKVLREQFNLGIPPDTKIAQLIAENKI